MFETVPYLRRANLGLVRPENPRLEAVLVVLLVERYLRLEPKVLPSFLNLYEEVMPSATRAARNVHSSGLLRTMDADGASAREMVLALSREILIPDAPVFFKVDLPKRALAKSPVGHDGVHSEHDEPGPDGHANAEE